MTLVKKQTIFLINFAKLILWAQQNGFEGTAGELHRTDEQHAWNLKKGLSKATRSKHQDRLAGDLNLFVKGVYQTTRTPYKPLADYWKTLHTDNRAGYDWGWDANHFEMT
jgi:hypothetical protein